jgi:hypothetical protein
MQLDRIVVWLVLRERWLGVDQSWIDPGAPGGGGGDFAGAVVGPSVAGAVRGGACVPDVALGGGSELMGGVSAGLSSSLWGGRRRVRGGRLGTGGGKYVGGGGGGGKYIGGGGPPHQPTAHPAHTKQPPQPP